MSKAFDANKYVSKSLDKDTVLRLKEVFDVFDYDGSGNISAEELINTIKALNLESQADQILNVVNSSGHEGEMDFKSFLDIFGFSQQSKSEGSIRQIFDRFDYHKQGFFGCQQFEKLSREVGFEFSFPEIDEMVLYADLDKDGGISYEQFESLMTKKYPQI